MDEMIQNLLNENEKIKAIKELPTATLKIIKLYLKNNLLEILEQNQEEKMANEIAMKAATTCMLEEYNYLVQILKCKYKIETEEARGSLTKKIGTPLSLCKGCLLTNCIKHTVSEFLLEMKKINQERVYINPLSVIEELLKTEKKEDIVFTTMTEKSLFEEAAVYTLLFVDTILDNDFIEMERFDEVTRIAKFKYLDLTIKEDFEFYINKIYKYYHCEAGKELEIQVDDFKLLPDEDLKDYQYFYQLAAFYLYKEKVEKINVREELKKYLEEKEKESIVQNRGKFFIGVYNNKIEELPCNEKAKDKLKALFNYILNYYTDNSTPYIPINILMYTEDKEIVKKIVGIIGDFMWYFRYLSKDMKYYEQSMNEIILNKSELKDLYTVERNNKIYNKLGMLTIDDFENIMFANTIDKNIILNVLTEKIEKNNSRVCNVIYGNKEAIKSILSTFPRLSTTLFNIELDINELSVEEIYIILIGKIQTREKLNEEVKEKIYQYIKLTYGNSEVKNMEYVKVLYNQIILQKLSSFKTGKNNFISLEDIPNVYNTRDLPEILADLNNLVGLDKIKEQINNLVSLLKFNKNANIDISKFNLHMAFIGNPGTGKTTVARLLSDILFNLGYIRKNKLVEVSAKDLIGEYIGQTSGKTYNVLKSALGGILFIDEAYSITSMEETSTSYASDCISTILRVMEDQRDNLIVIFAGYQQEMEKFIKFNPGLQSRIGYKIEFPDYSINELMQIFYNLLQKDKFDITKEAENEVRYIVEQSATIENFGNARYINKIYQDILIAHAKNIGDTKDKKKLMLIEENDIHKEDLSVKGKVERKIGF